MTDMQDQHCKRIGMAALTALHNGKWEHRGSRSVFLAGGDAQRLKALLRDRVGHLTGWALQTVPERAQQR